MSWSNNAWHHSINIIRDIEQCPFVRELYAGTLPFDKFIFYIEQDNIYLNNFALRLSLLHTQIKDNTTKAFVAEYMQNTIDLERGLHDYIGETFNTQFNKKAQPTLANIRYNELYEDIKQKNNPALTYASLLPCFWVYAHIGKTIFDNMAANNPFAAWINTYGNESFSIEADTFRHLSDTHSATCDTNTIDEMTNTFKIFTEMELLFWNDSYNQRTFKTD